MTARNASRSLWAIAALGCLAIVLMAAFRIGG